jgi:FAD:protein FMN transferase
MNYERLKRNLLITLSVFILFFVAGIYVPRLSREPKAYEISEVRLGTVVSIIFYADKSIDYGYLRESCLKKLDEADRVFSVHREDSELSTLNREASQKPFYPSPPLLDVIRLSRYYRDASGGAFDPTVYPLLKLWKLSDFDEQGEENPPDEQEIKSLLPLLGMDEVDIRENGFIQFKNDKISLDLGGIAKGYIIDDLADFLMKQPGVGAGVVNIGGDLRVFRGDKDSRPMKIGIRDPLNRDAVIGYAEVKEGGIVTSGGYERFRESKGKKYIHIIDPSTGHPVDNGVLSVTVMGGTAVHCDALATAFLVLGPERSLAIAEKEKVKVFFIVQKNGKIEQIPLNGFVLKKE